MHSPLKHGSYFMRHYLWVKLWYFDLFNLNLRILETVTSFKALGYASNSFSTPTYNHTGSFSVYNNHSTERCYLNLHSTIACSFKLAFKVFVDSCSFKSFCYEILFNHWIYASPRTTCIWVVGVLNGLALPNALAVHPLM